VPQYFYGPRPRLLRFIAAENLIVGSFVADIAHLLVVQDIH
jgi:hypothetical protein